MINELVFFDYFSNDIIIEISKLLDYEDWFHMRITCKKFYGLFGIETMSFKWNWKLFSRFLSIPKHMNELIERRKNKLFFRDEFWLKETKEIVYPKQWKPIDGSIQNENEYYTSHFSFDLHKKEWGSKKNDQTFPLIYPEGSYLIKIFRTGLLFQDKNNSNLYVIPEPNRGKTIIHSLKNIQFIRLKKELSSSYSDCDFLDLNLNNGDIEINKKPIRECYYEKLKIVEDLLFYEKITKKINHIDFQEPEYFAFSRANENYYIRDKKVIHITAFERHFTKSFVWYCMKNCIIGYHHKTGKKIIGHIPLNIKYDKYFQFEKIGKYFIIGRKKFKIVFNQPENDLNNI